MNTQIRTLLLAFALCISGSASHAQTILNATFETDRLGGRPMRDLPGPPAADELLYLGSGDYVSVVSFPTAAGHRALQLTAIPGIASGIIELASTSLPPGERSRIRGHFTGMIPGKGRLVVTLSRDSAASLFALEFSDGNLILHVVDSDGTTRDRIPFARYNIGRAHSIALDVDVRTGKSQITFQEAGRSVVRSPTFRSAGASAIGNARTVSYVFDYTPLQDPKGHYLLDEAELRLNRP